MKVNVTGRHVKVTSEMEADATDKVHKLGKFFSGIHQADVLMDVNGLTHTAEITVLLGQGQKLFGKADAEDIYAAVDLAEGKLEKQIRRYHARIKGHRDRTRIGDEPGSPAPAADEETYENVVREMLDKDES